VTPARVLVGFVAIVIALNIGLRAVEGAFGGRPGGAASSAFGTSPEGAAAYGELLRRAGHRVTRSRELPRDLRVPAATTTVVLLDPGLVEDADAQALRRFLESGGRLVAAGTLLGWLHQLLDEPPDWSPEDVADTRTLAPRSELAAIRRLVADGGSWSSAGETLPLLGERQRSLLTVARVGRGEAFLLATSAPLLNENLDDADDASLGLALAGPRARDVTFLERYHGAGRGFDALPDEWLFTLAGMAVAALAFMLARGRRLGQPEPEERELAPARALFVESLGALLGRTRSPVEALEPLRMRALAAAQRLPGADEELPIIEREPRTPEEIVALGRAAAHLERRVGWRR
jgi:hypothetical protein